MHPYSSKLLLTGFLSLAGTASLSALVEDAAVPADMDTASESYVIGSSDPYETTFVDAVYVGHTNSLVSLMVRNGSVLTSEDATSIGYGVDADYNTLTVTGTDTLFDVLTAIYLGYNGANNQMDVTSGATVNSRTFTVGFASSSSDNDLAVQGSGTLLNIGRTFLVGNAGSGNSVSVSGSAMLMAYDMTVGQSGSGNSVSVSGTGSTLFVRRDTFLGYYGDNNSISVTSGATYSTKSIIAGHWNTSSGNTVTVSGSGSKLSASYSITVGNAGASNSMTVSSGASVIAQIVSVGYGSEDDSSYGNNNTLTVTGANTTLTASSLLYVGTYGSNNTMTVSDGAYVSAGDLFIGSEAGATGNSLTISGANSIVSAMGVTIGNTGNTLIIGTDALLKIGAGSLSIASGNLIRFADEGFIAWSGDHVSDFQTLLGGGYVYCWNTDAYELGSASNVEIMYFDNAADAQAFAGGIYEGLDGYTIMRSTVPEPSTFALLGGIACIGSAASKRRRA
jgi:T5SS/PEP-CTERM-associated repeat protein